MLGLKDWQKIAITAVVLVAIFTIIATWPEPDSYYDAPLRPGNNPQFLVSEGSTEGVVLAHGFGASPWEMSLLAEYLHDAGYTVYNVRLAGHGTTIEDFRRTKWEQWYESVYDGYVRVSNVSDHVYAVGMSTGAALILQLAEKEELDGVVSINAPVMLRDKLARASAVGKYVLDSVHKDLEEHEKPYVYDTRPISAVHELIQAIDAYKDDLDKIDEKILVIQSMEDRTVEPASAYVIYDGVSSDYKQMKWYNTSQHGITRTEDREYLYPDILYFLESSPVFKRDS